MGLQPAARGVFREVAGAAQALLWSCHDRGVAAPCRNERFAALKAAAAAPRRLAGAVPWSEAPKKPNIG